MTELLALSVSVAVLGGIWAFIALGPLGGFALVWIGFIAAGCFFAAGGDTKALKQDDRRNDLWRHRRLDRASHHCQSSGARIGNGVARYRRRSDGLLSRYRGFHRSALLCASQCLWVCRARGLHVVGRERLDALTAADNSNPLFLVVVSAILGSRARLPYGAIGYGVLKSRPGRTDTSARSST